MQIAREIKVNLKQRTTIYIQKIVETDKINFLSVFLFYKEKIL